MHDAAVYKLEAVDHIEQADQTQTEERMLIGFFDSPDACGAVINDYGKLPGFSLGSCEFIITPYTVPTPDGSEINSVFYVQWCRDCDLTGEQESAEIGLFLTTDEAEKAKNEYIARRWTELPRGTEVFTDEYGIDQRHWQEGFARYTWMEEQQDAPQR